MNGEEGDNVGAVNRLVLLVQTPHGGPHALGTNGHDVYFIREFLPKSVEVSQQKAMGQAKRGTLQRKKKRCSMPTPPQRRTLDVNTEEGT